MNVEMVKAFIGDSAQPFATLESFARGCSAHVRIGKCSVLLEERCDLPTHESLLQILQCRITANFCQGREGSRPQLTGYSGQHVWREEGFVVVNVSPGNCPG
jgi:hypothetical protein